MYSINSTVYWLSHGVHVRGLNVIYISCKNVCLINKSQGQWGMKNRKNVYKNVFTQLTFSFDLGFRRYLSMPK